MNLNDKGFYDWAVRKVARDMIIGDKVNFAKQYPSDEVKHIYKVLDDEVAFVLAREGIPITRDELHMLFLEWFVRRTLPPESKQGDDSDPNPREGYSTLNRVLSS